jgi:hypothetical protein
MKGVETPAPPIRFYGVDSDNFTFTLTGGKWPIVVNMKALVWWAVTLCSLCSASTRLHGILSWKKLIYAHHRQNVT